MNMNNINVNNSLFSLDNFFYNNELITKYSINGYPLLTILLNIFLLIIPFLLCLLLVKYWEENKFEKFYQKILALIMGIVWLVFIPNTAYVITDIRHLLNYCDSYYFFHVCIANAWMIMVFFVYACLGWVSFVVLLNQMKKFIIKLGGKKISDIFIAVIIPVISLGVLLGLINRWNSWEFFIYPHKILANLPVYFTDFYYFRNFVVFTVSLYILYCIGNWFFKNSKL